MISPSYISINKKWPGDEGHGRLRPQLICGKHLREKSSDKAVMRGAIAVNAAKLPDFLQKT
jgi:hypothetical protein